MSHTSFVCPECNAQVDPSENIFCENCGINLSRYDRLEKKTFYSSEEYCEKCNKPGGLTRSAKKIDKVKLDEFQTTTKEYIEIHCSLCGESSTKVVSSNTIDSRVEDSEKRRFSKRYGEGM